jgi:hypothetical protein
MTVHYLKGGRFRIQLMLHSWYLGAGRYPRIFSRHDIGWVVSIGPLRFLFEDPTAMKIGTLSVLFGAHQFLLHPLFLARSWFRLWGFRTVQWRVPWSKVPIRLSLRDPRVWLAFFVHDLGYLGKPNMDGDEGEEHPLLGARIMSKLFDGKKMDGKTWANGETYMTNYKGVWMGSWGLFSLLHSRFLAKKLSLPFSPLCVADKLTIVTTPRRLYLASIRLTGEIEEYMAGVADKYRNERRRADTVLNWYNDMCAYLTKWVAAHKDLGADTMTTDGRKSTETGVWQ